MDSAWVFVASRMEGRPVQRLIRSSSGTNVFAGGPVTCEGRSRVELVITGMGPVAAKRRAKAVLSGDRGFGRSLRPKPDAILVTGLCGAVSGSLEEGALVAYHSCICSYDSRPKLHCDRALTERVTDSLRMGGVPCLAAAGVTASRIAVSRAEKLDLGRSGAAVVDMESYEILAAAAEAEVPAAVLRVVCDSVSRSIPDFNRAIEIDGSLNFEAALRFALFHPLSAASLFAASRRAMKLLDQALGILFATPSRPIALESPHQ